MIQMPPQLRLEEILVELAGNPTIRMAVGLYEKIGMPAADLAQRTCIEYGRDLADLLAFLEGVGTFTVAQVSQLHLLAYQAEMIRRGYTPPTRNRRAHAIKRFFTFLYSQGVTTSDIGSQLIPPRVPYQEPRYLSAGERTRLISACSGHVRDHALIQLVLQTGITLSQLARLTLEDVEIPRQITTAAEDCGWVQVSRRGARRLVSLNDTAGRSLRDWLAVRPRSSHQVLWTTMIGDPLSSRSIRRSVAGYLRRAGILHASVHTLRHTMAVHRVAAGTTLQTLQKTLGHAEVKTTAQYVPLARQTKRKALQEHAL